MAAALSTTAGAQSKVATLNANSTKLNVELLQDANRTVQLNRYFFAGYNTLCLPVSLTAEQVAAAAKDLRVERLVAIKQVGSDLNLYFVDCTSEGIQAGEPYLVYSPTKQYMNVKSDNVTGVNTAINAVRLSDNEGNQVTFSSSWNLISKEGLYGIPAKQPVTPLESVLIRTDADKSFLPTRCGFSWDSQAASASALKIQHVSAGDITAITSVKKSAESTAVYGLDGQRINGKKKGINITNGKKVVIK